MKGATPSCNQRLVANYLVLHHSNLDGPYLRDLSPCHDLLHRLPAADDIATVFCQWEHELESQSVQAGPALSLCFLCFPTGLSAANILGL